MDSAPQPDLVYDVGAHQGEDSDFYLKAGYRVIAVEANPDLADTLRARFADAMAQGRFVLVERAVAAQPGRVAFYVNEHLSEWGTVDPAWAARNASYGAPSRRIEVEAIDFAAILTAHGCPHYCKIDIEGADLLCLAALERTGIRPAYLSIEAADVSWRMLCNEFAALCRLGYNRFKVVDQRHHLQGTSFAARDGTRFRHDFQMGASGPFGEDVPGPWLTLDQALRVHRRVHIFNALVGKHPRLLRLIGRIPLLRRLARLVSWHDTHAVHDSVAAR